MNSLEMWQRIAMTARASRLQSRALASCVREVRGSLVVSNALEAASLRESWGIDTIVLTSLPEERHQEAVAEGHPLVFAPYAVADICQRYENQLAALAAERKKLVAENTMLKNKLDEMK